MIKKVYIINDKTNKSLKIKSQIKNKFLSTNIKKCKIIHFVLKYNMKEYE